MSELNEHLRERDRSDNPIRVGLIGAGQMGSEIVAQIGEMRGMEVVVIAEVSHKLAQNGYSGNRKKPSVVKCDTAREAESAISKGKCVATTDFRIATETAGIDAIVDATGSVEIGAKVALSAIENKKHVVMMSVECDITIGPILNRLARSAGVVYSLAAGDEPAAIVELFRFADTLGFEVISAGKGKNNPLNHYATPDSEREKAISRQMNPRMLCEFVDGSKTAIEMAAVSNATGLLPDIRGMHGPKASVETLKSIFIPEKDGGVMKSRGVVDYAIGVHPGVFTVIYSDNEKICHGMNDRDMGPGPYFTLYRPYHLCSVEVPITIGEAVVYGASSGKPGNQLLSECFPVSKTDLKKGTMLDGIGEYCYRGSVERADIAKEHKLLPLGIAKGARILKDVPNDTPITYDMVELVEDSLVIDLRNLQDKTTVTI